MTKDDVLGWVRSSTMIEISELVKAIEEEFGVTAAAPIMAGMMPMTGAGGAAAEAVEQTEFDVILTGFGQQKIQVIRVVRELTSLGLKEAKDLVDGVPKPVKEKVSREEADQVKAKLEEVGASVEIK
ncbi:MAG: 50S ribosomal protein L7/L12 [Candidatus Eisenbacteria bacterium]|uniref:Large ribosomal subunit protein bL12 n=1 Tax=Eiseniibacteriota bacterium TaxID=2212470 RepID=A0A938BMA2_UNCEI|nr:50S ribosomal protein L7/L12 [Candidatus Eisenbacteria bacterium]